MASSDAEVPEQVATFFERFLRHRNLSLFVPFFHGYADPPTNDTNLSHDTVAEESGQQASVVESNRNRERVILVNPFTQGMVVIEGVAAGSLENILQDLGSKRGQPPASKASIEALRAFAMEDGDELVGECVICLEDWEVGTEVKMMPCSHRFHSGCVEKWLGMHGSCPVCRYTMPVDEEDRNQSRDADETEELERMRRMDREIWVSFSFSGGRRNSDEQVEEGDTTAVARISNPASEYSD